MKMPRWNLLALPRVNWPMVLPRRLAMTVTSLSRCYLQPWTNTKNFSQVTSTKMNKSNIFTTNRANTNADRKSTRLNSSHVAISYAVFCLKKKKYNKTNYIMKQETHQSTYYTRCTNYS